MKRIQARETVSPFEAHELFFSRTQRNGVIAAGNRIFARVSGYAINDMIGKAHSLVRHPQMPRAVFKLLWDGILSGRPVSAYVKNLSSDGSYYWVFASVYPVGDGFVSIRMKPTTPVLEKVEALYRELVAQEPKQSLDDGVSALLAGLANLGFASYGDFMTAAFGMEIEAALAPLQSTATASSSDASLSWIGPVVRKVQNEVTKAFELFERSARALTELDASFSELEALTAEYDLLPINLTLSTQRGGSAQRTTEVLARLFSDQKAEMSTFVTEFREVLGEAGAKSVLPLKYDVGSCLLQVSMIDQFLADVFAPNDTHDPTRMGHAEAARESHTLAEMAQVQLGKALDGASDLKTRFVKILSHKEDLNVLVNSVSSVAQLGLIEISRETAQQNAMLPQVEEMRSMASRVAEKVKAVNACLENAREALNLVSKTLTAASRDVFKCQMALEKIASAGERAQDSGSFDTEA